MAINSKIMDKLVQQAKDDYKARAVLTELLDRELEGIANYKPVYKKLIEDSVYEEEHYED